MRKNSSTITTVLRPRYHLLSKLIGLVAVFLASDAIAEAVIPKAVVYDAESKEDDKAKYCAMIAMLLHPSSAPPEFIDFRVVAVIRKDASPSIIRFVIYVGNLVLADGQPVGRRMETLLSATFDSPRFSAPTYPVGDGGMMSDAMTSMTDTYADFLKAFTEGLFELTFARRDRPAPRTYRVSQGPPRHVMSAFSECFKSAIRR